METASKSPSDEPKSSAEPAAIEAGREAAVDVEKLAKLERSLVRKLDRNMLVRLLRSSVPDSFSAQEN